MTEGEESPARGVMIFPGIKPGFRAGDLQIIVDDNGEVKAKAILSTSYNVIPMWLRIAQQNVLLAKQGLDEITANWDKDPESRSSLLVAELTPSIQTYVACGIAFDALYDQLKPFVKLSESDIAAWKENKTKRSAQITEVIRRAYNLKPTPLKKIKLIVGEITKFRDYAVHPPRELRPAVTRPDIKVGLDWVFCAYRYETALACFDNTLTIFSYLRDLTPSQKEINEEMKYTFDTLNDLGLG